MDLRFPDAEPTLAEVQALDAVLGQSLVAEGWERERGGAHRAGAMRHKLLPALHALRERREAAAMSVMAGFISGSQKPKPARPEGAGTRPRSAQTG